MAGTGNQVSSASPAGPERRPHTSPKLVFGTGVLHDLAGRLVPQPYALVAQPEPLGMVNPALAGDAAHLVLAGSLAEADLNTLEREVPDVAAVVGLGGGTAMDTAKYLAWRRGVPVVLAPSAISVDASVTNTIAIRAEGSVQYRGFVVAEHVVVDFGVIGQAPVRMNRAGIGDLLSIHTALWDWEHGASASRGGAQLVPAAADRARRILDRITGLAPQIRDVTPQAIEAVVRAYLEINEQAIDLGHAQLEEGSEHYFAYCLEHLTGRPLIHGEAVTLGTVMMSELQGNASESVRATADIAGVAWRPAELGVTWQEVASALRTLPAFVREADLPWSVIDDAGIGERAVERLAEVVR